MSGLMRSGFLVVLASIGVVAASVVAPRLIWPGKSSSDGLGAVNAGPALNDTDRRYQAVIKALNADPTNIDLRLRQLELTLDRADYASARALASVILSNLTRPAETAPSQPRTTGRRTKARHPAHYHLRLGRSYMRLGQYADAIDQFDQLIERPSYRKSAILHKAESLFRLGQFKDVLTVLETGFGDDTAYLPERLFIQARAVDALGVRPTDDVAGETPETLVRALAKDNPWEPRYWHWLARLSLRQNNLSAARADISALRNAGGDRLGADLLDVEISVRDGQFDDARGALNALALDHAQDRRVTESLAILLAQQGEVVRAAQLLDSLYTANHFDLYRALRLAAIKVDLGDDVQARELLNEIKQRAPDNPMAIALETALEIALAQREPSSDKTRLIKADRSTAVRESSGSASDIVESSRNYAAFLDRQREALLFAADGDGVDTSGQVTSAVMALFGPHADLLAQSKQQAGFYKILEEVYTHFHNNRVSQADGLAHSLDGNGHADLLGLVRAEMALTTGNDLRAARALSRLSEAAQQSHWANRLSSRLTLRDDDRAKDQDVFLSSPDDLLAYQLSKGDISGAYKVAILPGPFRNGALYARFVEICLEESPEESLACAPGNANVGDTKEQDRKNQAVIIETLSGFQQDLHAQAALVRLYSHLGLQAKAGQLYRNFFGAFGTTLEGARSFIDLVGVGDSREEIVRFLSAQASQEDAKIADAAHIIRKKIIADQARRSIAWDSFTDEETLYPVTLWALAQDLDRYGLSRPRHVPSNASRAIPVKRQWRKKMSVLQAALDDQSISMRDRAEITLALLAANGVPRTLEKLAHLQAEASSAEDLLIVALARKAALRTLKRKVARKRKEAKKRKEASAHQSEGPDDELSLAWLEACRHTYILAQSALAYGISVPPFSQAHDYVTALLDGGYTAQALAVARESGIEIQFDAFNRVDLKSFSFSARQSEGEAAGDRAGTSARAVQKALK